MMNGGNKFTLEIKLIGNSGLEITFLHWDERFLSDYNNKDSKDDKFVYFESADQEFCMYSHEDGYILDDGQFGLIVPDKENMKTGFVLSHEFIHDDRRYHFLKLMQEHMSEWATDWDTFKDDKEVEHDFLIHEQYWIY